MTAPVYSKWQPYSTKGVTVIDFVFTVGASGAPTIVTTGGASSGIYAVSRSAVGRYALYLTILNSARFDKYLRFIHGNVSLDYSSSTNISVLPSVQFDLVNLGTSVSNNYARICFVAPTVATGPTLSTAFTDPPDGSTVRGTLYLKKGSAL